MSTPDYSLSNLDINVLGKQQFTQINKFTDGTNWDSTKGCWSTTSNNVKVDDFFTGITISATPHADSEVQVFLNGIRVELGDGDKRNTTAGDDTAACYFSGDNGATARAIADITQGDKFYWNSNIAGYAIDFFEAGSRDNDDLDFAYFLGGADLDIYLADNFTPPHVEENITLSNLDVNLFSKQEFTKVAAGQSGTTYDSNKGCWSSTINGQPVDHFDTGFTVSQTPHGDAEVQVFVNALRIEVGDGSKTDTSNGVGLAACYFSGDNGSTARQIKDIQKGDKFYWNSIIAGYTLDYFGVGDPNNDDLDFAYFLSDVELADFLDDNWVPPYIEENFTTDPLAQQEETISRRNFVVRTEQMQFMYKGGDYLLKFQITKESGKPIHLGYLPDGSTYNNNGSAILFVVLYDELGRTLLSFANDGTGANGEVDGFELILISDQANGEFVLPLQSNHTKLLYAGRLYAGVYFETNPDPNDFKQGNYDINIIEDLQVGVIRSSELMNMLGQSQATA